MELSGDAVVLRPVRAHAIVKKERGVWVYQSNPDAAAIPELKDRIPE